MNITDTHAHLQWKSFDRDRSEVIKRAKQVSVSRVINIGYNIASSKSAVEMAQMYDGLYAAVGIHPHEAVSVSSSAVAQLLDLCTFGKVVAIGETGLDFYRDLSPRGAQKEAFERQLVVARNRDLPIVVHVREAYKEVHEILSKYAGQLRGVIHCWSGSIQMATSYLELGFHIAIGGPITYTSARKLAEIVKYLPLNRMLVETDCPWLAPQSHRGKRNEPSLLPEIIARIAEIRGTTPEAIAGHTSSNAADLFNIE